MPKVHKRKYEKVEDDEIDLVVKCTDSHEFYERYREAFPTKKKGIDSISKIWKRRGEFVKKLPDAALPLDPSLTNSVELEKLMVIQNKILEELHDVMKEHLKVSREILTHLPKPVTGSAIHVPSRPETKVPDQNEPKKRVGPEKPSDIMIGS